ncbi:response regulator [Hyphomicrobium sp. 99]|uniref:response regulator n=1 Tax=Hyphomicrobium sp. 99 TaxID=1163419 RepID=UPI0005F7B3AC|nr:response regulator [Hyphomicrobium sp. 99]
MSSTSPATATGLAPLASATLRSRPLIVVIEDDYRSSMALTMLIDDWGYSCITGRSCREAVQALGNRLNNVSAIITDIEINGEMRGIRDALALAASIGHAVPTIITTGHADLAWGSSPFPVVGKPFDPDILHRWLVHNLGPALP